MSEVLLIQICAIFILGALSQWLAWRLNLPSILLLLLTGFCVGSSGIDFIDPDQLLGQLLFPFVSISVAIILFEGGLSLRLNKLKGQATVISLISLGCLVTWLMAATAANSIFGIDWKLSLLLGAILTVSGPTVVTPLLRHIKPTPPLGQILKWEGILIDPVGALLAVFVFEIIWEDLAFQGWGIIVFTVLKTVFVGGGIGFVAAWVLTFFLRRRLLPDSLNNSFTVMLVLLCFIASNSIQKEAGLLGVTVMGMALANLQPLQVRKILEFKENLVVFLISTLFILLAARISPADWKLLPIGQSFLFLGVLIFVIRPSAVFISTLFSSLSLRQRLFMSFLAPRGIVAAAVASLFALELQHAGVENSNLLISFTFLVVVGSVAFYGIFAFPVASLLKVRLKAPQGVLFVGANEISREIGKAIKDLGFEAHFVDTNPSNITSAWLQGFPATLGNAVSEQVVESLNLDGIGKLFAMTPNHEANALAAVRYAELFGEDNVYQLTEPTKKMETMSADSLAEHLKGRTLFSPEVPFEKLRELKRKGWSVKTTKITEEFSYNDYRERNQENSIPLLYSNKEGKLITFVGEEDSLPTAGSRLIALSQAS